MIHKDSRKHVERRIKWIEIDGLPTQFTKQKILRLDGTPRNVEAGGIPFEYEKRPAVLVALRDITASTEAEAILREPKGRRGFLRKRVLDTGAGVLSDGEILELILYAALPHGNALVLADRLIEEFGSLGKVANADHGVLLRVPGVGNSTVAILKSAVELSVRLSRAKVADRPIIPNSKELLDYLHHKMDNFVNESFSVLFLDRKLMLLADEVMNTGTLDKTAVYPREVVRRALNLGASSVILVHNHPSGDVIPSNDDITLTGEIVDAAAAVDLLVLDHIIIGLGSSFSFKKMHLL